MTACTQSVKLAELDLRLSRLRLADPKVLARLRESVALEGLRTPVLVSDAIDQKRLVVVDGFKRIRVVEERGEETILARTESLDVAGAHRAILMCNGPTRGLTALEEGWLVQSLHRAHCMPQTKIAELLGRHKSWVCRRLMMVEEVTQDVLEDVRVGLLSSVHVRHLCQLPRVNQMRARDAVTKHGLSSRQTAMLVTRLRSCCDPKAQDELLADPLKHMAAETGKGTCREKDPRLSQAGNLLRDCLLDIQDRAFWLRRTVRAHPPGRLTGDEAEILTEVVHDTVQALDEAMEPVRTLAGHWRPHERTTPISDV